MMTPDFRYHVASLASVFLALGVGVVIGTAFVGTPVMNRMEGRIKRQELRIAELQQRTNGQEKNEEALKMLVPRLTAGSLVGLEIIVVQLGDDRRTADAVETTIKKCGGKARRLSLPDAPWRNLESLERERQTRLLAQTLRGNMEASQRMTDGLLHGELPPASASRVVFAGGEDELRRSRDLPLAVALKDDNCTVVGGELLGAEVSGASTYKSASVSFIDCIDRSVGQIALTHVLRGKSGWFGVKDDADRVLPDVFKLRPGARPIPGEFDALPTPSTAPSATPEASRKRRP